MKLGVFLLLFVAFFNVKAQTIDVTNYGVAPNSFLDATEGVKRAIEASRDQPSSVINFPAGRYDFWPDKAEENKYFISNTSTEE